MGIAVTTGVVTDSTRVAGSPISAHLLGQIDQIKGLKREAEVAAPAEEVCRSVSWFLLTDFPFLPHLWLQPGVFLLTSSCDCGGQTQLFMALLELLGLTTREEEKEKSQRLKERLLLAASFSPSAMTARSHHIRVGRC